MKSFQIAIVGAGPAGYFAAQALQNLESEELKFQIDLIERLPTPWGLVRSGVAPDHPKIKSVSKVFEKIATAGNVNLFGNIEVGTDISMTTLQEKYDAVVIATGASVGKKLGIPGEDLPGNLSSADFVPWYNGHPDFSNLEISFDCETAVVIGAGNVAMDVARMLALDPTELDPTDTAEYAIAALKKSKIRKVYICARRGPEFAAFTAPELRELKDLEHTNVIISKTTIDDAIFRAGENPEKHVKSNLDAMALLAERSNINHERTMQFEFGWVPTAIKGNGKVEEVVFNDGKESVKCGLVISAIGYTSKPIPDVDLKNQDGFVSGNTYVVGWAKRGPSGVIGTNKSDAADVMELLVSKLGNPKPKFDLISELPNKKIVTQGIWEKINAAEIANGESVGKPRIKAVNRDDLLSLGGL